MEKHERQPERGPVQDMDIPYEMTVAGHPEDNLWDDMVKALKPDLMPKKQQ